MCLFQYNLLAFQNEGNDFLIVLALMYDIVASLVQIAMAINQIRAFWLCHESTSTSTRPIASSVI